MVVTMSNSSKAPCLTPSARVNQWSTGLAHRVRDCPGVEVRGGIPLFSCRFSGPAAVAVLRIRLSITKRRRVSLRRAARFSARILAQTPISAAAASVQAGAGKSSRSAFIRRIRGSPRRCPAPGVGRAWRPDRVSGLSKPCQRGPPSQPRRCPAAPCGSAVAVGRRQSPARCQCQQSRRPSIRVTARRCRSRQRARNRPRPARRRHARHPWGLTRPLPACHLASRLVWIISRYPDRSKGQGYGW